MKYFLIRYLCVLLLLFSVQSAALEGFEDEDVLTLEQL